MKHEQGQALALPNTAHAIVPLMLGIQQRLLFLPMKKIRRWKEESGGTREIFKETLGKICFLKGETTNSGLLLLMALCNHLLPCKETNPRHAWYTKMKFQFNVLDGNCST